jgi:hypothetical protein
MTHHEVNRWKGFVLGALSGVAGVLAMRAYWQAATAITGQDPRQVSKEGETPPALRALDSISLVGRNHKEGESSTEAMGRILYRLVVGQEPQSQETRTTLSYLIHWIISMFMSGVYGAARGPAGAPDAQGGMALGAGLWLFGDELAMPLLGLTDGPTAYPPQLHAHSWGAHLAYGLASSGATQLLHLLF